MEETAGAPARRGIGEGSKFQIFGLGISIWFEKECIKRNLLGSLGALGGCLKAVGGEERGMQYESGSALSVEET